MQREEHADVAGEQASVLGCLATRHFGGKAVIQYGQDLGETGRRGIGGNTVGGQEKTRPPMAERCVGDLVGLPRVGDGLQSRVLGEATRGVVVKSERGEL